MCLFRSIINKFWSKKHSPNKNFTTNQTQNIIIKPNGTWVFSQPPVPPINPPIHIPPPVSVVPGKDYLLYSEPDVERIQFPPEFFPHAKELYDKLEKCLDLEVISSCVHKQTENRVYLLSVELPCGDSHSESMQKFKTFVRVMQETYKLKPIQQEHVRGGVCSQQHYLVVFEYDSRQFKVQVKEEPEE